MHVPRLYCVVVYTFGDPQVGPVDIDGVIGHHFIESVSGENHPFARRKVSCIGLGGEIAKGIVLFQANGEPVQGDIFAHLCQQTHPLGIVYLNILNDGVAAFTDKDAGSRTFPRTENIPFTR